MTLVFVGKEGNKVWKKARKRLQDHVRWKMWESDNFIQCGVRAEHQKDEGFPLSRNEFVDELRSRFQSHRRKEKDSPVCYNNSRQSGEDCWVAWAGHVNKQDHNTALPQDFNVAGSNKQQFRT